LQLKPPNNPTLRLPRDTYCLKLSEAINLRWRRGRLAEAPLRQLHHLRKGEVMTDDEDPIKTPAFVRVVPTGLECRANLLNCGMGFLPRYGLAKR
jgi:hypothetical protein